MNAPISTDVHLQAWMAAPADRRAAAHAALLGASSESDAEQFLTLREVAAAVRKHPSWLHRLLVPERCGVRLAGRRAYRLRSVLSYLQSPDCLARVRELGSVRCKSEDTDV